MYSGFSCYRSLYRECAFGNALAGTFIRTLGWICPFLYLGVTLSSILHGLGYPGITFVLNLIACGIRILFVLFALPVYGIRGYLWDFSSVGRHGSPSSIGILLRQTHPTSRSASAKICNKKYRQARLRFTGIFILIKSAKSDFKLYSGQILTCTCIDLDHIALLYEQRVHIR